MTLNKLIGTLMASKERSEALFDREAKASKHIPWSYFVCDEIFSTTSGCLGAVIKVEGIPFEVQDTEELDRLQHSLGFLIQSLGDEFGLYVTLHRNQHANALVGAYKAGFAEDFCKAYQEQFKGSSLFKNDLYVTLLLKPHHTVIPKGIALAQRFKLKSDHINLAEKHEIRLKKMKAACVQLTTALKVYSPTLLGKRVLNGSAMAEPLSFLSLLVNGQAYEFSPPHQDIASYVPCVRLFFGYDTIHFQGAVTAEDQFAAILSIKHYAPQSNAGLLDSLLTVPFEFISTHSFLSIEKNKALNLIETHTKRLRSTDDAALSQIAELESAKDDLASGRISYGYHHHTILVLGKHIKELEDKVALVTKLYQDKRIQVTRETLNLENAFWAQIPGNAKKIKRSAPISSMNFSCFCSLHNYYSGYIDQNHLGSALMLAETPSKTPLYFNLHERASGRSDDLPKGHTTIIGPSNAGKTVLLTTMDAMFQKYGIRSYFFDRNSGCELYSRAMGGHYHRLVPGEPTGWNPCQLPDTPQNRDFLRDFIEALSTSPQSPLTPGDLNQIAEVVERNYSLPLEKRNLSAIASFFRLDFSGLESLSRYCHSLNRQGKKGDRAYLFDNTSDSFNAHTTPLGFDMTHWLSEVGEPPEELLPISLYLFHRIDEHLDGQLTALYLDEGWQFLNQPYWQKKLDEYLVTWRKRNAFIVFASQLPDKVAASPMGPALIQGSATNIFLANPKAQEADYRGAFKLSPREFELIRSTPLQSRYFLMKQGHEAALARFNLHGLEKYLAVLSSNDQSVQHCAELRKQHGDDPACWLPYFYEETLA